MMPSRIFFRTVFVVVIILSFYSAHAQHIELLHQTASLSLRGLSVVNDEIVWVSGTKGTVGKSTDGGKTWWWTSVKGFETSDFRDIEAFSETTAVIMAISEPARILRTTDGGLNWKLVYENKTPGMFMDAMDFFDDQNGTVVGDAVAGKFFVSRTTDGGATWHDVPAQYLPIADSAEGCFASSGTNIRMPDKTDYIFVSVGKRSRVYYKKQFHLIPFSESKGSTGANSIAILNVGPSKDRWITVGGDFSKDSLRTKNCFISTDHGKTWTVPTTGPLGYRSCVEYITDTTLITCGLNGADYSDDGGVNWRTITTTGFHACRKAKKGRSVYLSGKDGRIGKLIVDAK